MPCLTTRRHFLFPFDMYPLLWYVSCTLLIQALAPDTMNRQHLMIIKEKHYGTKNDNWQEDY